MVHLGCQWGILTAHLGIQRPHHGTPGSDFDADGTFLAAYSSIVRMPARPMATFYRFDSNVVENQEIMQKPWFLHGFAMVSSI